MSTYSKATQFTSYSRSDIAKASGVALDFLIASSPGSGQIYNFHPECLIGGGSWATFQVEFVVQQQHTPDLTWRDIYSVVYQIGAGSGVLVFPFSPANKISDTISGGICDGSFPLNKSGSTSSAPSIVLYSQGQRLRVRMGAVAGLNANIYGHAYSIA